MLFLVLFLVEQMSVIFTAECDEHDDSPFSRQTGAAMLTDVIFHSRYQRSMPSTGRPVICQSSVALLLLTLTVGDAMPVNEALD